MAEKAAIAWFWILSRHWAGVAEEKILGIAVCGRGFESVTSRTQSRSIDHLRALGCFSCYFMLTDDHVRTTISYSVMDK
jgi:hypothetical protein